MDPRLLAAAGVDPELPAARAAAELVRRLPLRRAPAVGVRDPESVIESRWFAGTAECARVLGRVFRGGTGRGHAFASSWPILQAAGVVVAPGLPVAAEREEQLGPDGAYQLADGAVWREAVGERRALLATERAADSSADGSFELLWFGSSERYLVRGGSLEVDDLFSRLTVRATRQLLEQRLVRALRVEPAVLEGVTFGEREAAAVIEVRRPVELTSARSWRDPERVLALRADIVRTERRRDEIVAETGRETSVVFRVAEEAAGWRLFTWEGAYPFRTLALTEADGHLRFAATLGPDVDPWAPGVRGRVAFDLRSDLVALGKKGRG